MLLPHRTPDLTEEGDDNSGSIVLDADDCGTRSPHPLGDDFDVPVPTMGVAQRHAHAGIAKQTGDHRHRRPVHHSVAGMGMSQVVKPTVFDVGFTTDPIPEPDVMVARRWKHERAFGPGLFFQDIRGLIKGQSISV